MEDTSSGGHSVASGTGTSTTTAATTASTTATGGDDAGSSEDATTTTTSTGAATTGEEMPTCPADPLHPHPEAPSCVDEDEGSWSVMSDVGSPPQSDWYTMVWTGQEAIVWHGIGAAYDPSTDTWRTIATDGAPTQRAWHTAIWTGTEMIVWGGAAWPSSWEAFADGARYDPTRDVWSAVNATGAPAPRYSHTATWTGSEMIVWGGIANSTALVNGGRYDPQLDTWAPVSEIGAPPPGVGDVALWTGSEMIVWGGTAPTGEPLPGGRYDVASDTWSPMSMVGAPSFISQSFGFWTGSAALFYGGCCVIEGSYRNRAAAYDPIMDAWVDEVTLCSDASAHSVAVWTGCDLLVWRSLGLESRQAVPPDVLRFDGETTWRTSATSPPERRYRAKAVWTGDAMIVWGGEPSDGLGPGGVYRP